MDYNFYISVTISSLEQHLKQVKEEFENGEYEDENKAKEVEQLLANANQSLEDILLS